MNQYPGLVPMVVPQPYMVAMPTAIPMSSAGLTALPQMAAAQFAGAPVVTSSMATAGQGLGPGLAPGLPSAVGANPIAQGMGAVGMSLPPGQGPAGIPTGTATVIPHPPGSQGPQGLQGPDARKRSFGEMEKGKGPGGGMGGGGRFGNRWQAGGPEEDVEELNVDDALCVLDHYNSDLNLVIDPDGFGATVLTNPPGFCFTWAGVRATYGVCKGKVYYEVHILEHLPADFGDDHQEMDPHVVRLGWSIDSSSFQLGEEPWSFGYGGTGKFSTNCRFSDYGQRFGAGDVMGAMLDLDSRPATISFTKNGAWLGVALPLHGFPVGSKDMALFPHILSKNCRLKVNFGQMDPWFPPPPGFNYVGQLPQADRVHGMRPPEKKSDCEMIMIVGLPGVGKTTWAVNMQKSHPEKRYYIIGTDSLIDKMRVMGLPRKRNFHGRFEVLIDKATKCLNKMFQIAAKRKRNIILDQTNVYASARRRKMKSFQGFYRIAAVIQPEDAEMQRRSHKRTVEDGKEVPESAVLEMKANFSLPDERDGLFDRIDYVELPRDKVIKLVEQYVQEGQNKRPARENVFRHDNRFQQDRSTGTGPSGRGPPPVGAPFGQQGGAPPVGMGRGTGKRDPQWYGDAGGQEPMGKRMKLEGGRGGLGGARHGGGDPSSALDLLKQQYDEAEEPTQWGQGPGRILQRGGPVGVKEEPRWNQGQDMTGGMGRGQNMYGMPPPPPGQPPMAGFSTQPPPPPPAAQGQQSGAWPGGGNEEQQPWQGQTQGWQQGQGQRGPRYDHGRQTGDYGGQGDARVGGYNTQNFGPPGQSGHRFDDYSRPPPDFRTEGDGRGGGFGDSQPYGGGGGGGDQWTGRAAQDGDSEQWAGPDLGPGQSGFGASQQGFRGPGGRDFGVRGRGSEPAARDFGSAGKDFGPGGRGFGSGNRDLGPGDKEVRVGARGLDPGARDFPGGGRDSGLGGRDYRPGGRDSGPGGDRWSGGRHGERGQSDRWGSRQTGSNSRDRDRDRDGSRDHDRDSYRDRDRERDRDRDRGRDRDRDRDQEEPRQRRRKSKWDTPEDDAGPSAGGDSRFPATVKQEPADTGYGAPRQPPPPFQSSQQPPGNSPFPPPQGDRGPPGFSPRGPGFNKTPPPSQPPPAGGPGPMGPGGFKDRSSDLPSLMDVRFGGRPPPAGGPDSMAKDPKSGAGETSLLGPVPSGPPPKFAGTFPGGQKEGTAAVGSPSKGAPPPTDVVPPLPGAPGAESSPAVQPPFPPGGQGTGPGTRFPGPGSVGSTGGGPPRPNFRMDGPRSMRPANPQQNFGPSGPRGPPPMSMNRPPPGMGGPPGGPWNQNRFGGPGRGGPPMGPRFDGPGGPGGRFPGGPGPMRWPRGPR